MRTITMLALLGLTGCTTTVHDVLTEEHADGVRLTQTICTHQEIPRSLLLAPWATQFGRLTAEGCETRQWVDLGPQSQKEQTKDATR